MSTPWKTRPEDNEEDEEDDEVETNESGEKNEAQSDGEINDDVMRIDMGLQTGISSLLSSFGSEIQRNIMVIFSFAR